MYQIRFRRLVTATEPKVSNKYRWYVVLIRRGFFAWKCYKYRYPFRNWSELQPALFEFWTWKSYLLVHFKFLYYVERFLENVHQLSSKTLDGVRVWDFETGGTESPLALQPLEWVPGVPGRGPDGQALPPGDCLPLQRSLPARPGPESCLLPGSNKYIIYIPGSKRYINISRALTSIS